LSDTATDTAPSPASMPAAINVETETPTETTTPEVAETTTDGTLMADEREELARLRAIHKDEQKWERRAKENFEKAKRLDEIELAKKSVEERLIAERDAALATAESERTERLREKISRETQVPPDRITGTTEDDMRESAESALAWAKEFAKKNGSPLGAPASAVTGDGRAPQGAPQLTRADLKTMSSQQILEADKAGRLDKLKGINP
jgi:hypothetical protein